MSYMNGTGYLGTYLDNTEYEFRKYGILAAVVGVGVYYVTPAIDSSLLGVPLINNLSSELRRAGLASIYGIIGYWAQNKYSNSYKSTA